MERFERFDYVAARIKTTVEIDGTKYFGEIGTAKSTQLGFEDHGLFHVNIDFEFGGSAQGLGRILSPDTLMPVLIGIMHVFGVEHWEQVRGKTCFVLRQGETLNSIIHGFASLDGERTFLFS